MTRNTYAFSNGIYNDWHRQYEGIAMIDIDSVEVCKFCYEPLAIIETAYYKGHTNKATRPLLERLLSVAMFLLICCFIMSIKPLLNPLKNEQNTLKFNE
jgi:hypothetical protein